MKPVVFALALALVASDASAQLVGVADLNTRQIRALDRDRTVVILQGGMLEEHGPYLPAFTDGILSERLKQEIAQGVVAKKSLSASALKTTLEILDGADPATYPRLAMVKDSGTFSRFETSDVHPRVTGDLAVVTGRVQWTRSLSGRVAAEDWQFNKVYRRDASGWRVISYQAWALPK